MSKELKPLEVLQELRQNNKDNTHLFDDGLLDIIITDKNGNIVLGKE